EEVKKNVIPPDLIGSNNYETLVIGWGSTYTAITEALEEIGDKNISFLHYKQVYPLHPKTKDYLEKANKLIIIENNITSQFGKLIKLYTGLDIENKILKFTGMPFSVEELTEEIKKIVEGKK
ncbi:MAG: 2-oxoacid:acceptor oxidoreductase subunit alpha, partial [Candidatus Heimdallarchaeota archaeon]|nr:2-oxoacid:acceptor oxidoreductase subunit alpha [Candidatus Heimdallarchaeota archaeon]